jgi:NADH dehydrogenase FAD-containing subunit
VSDYLTIHFHDTYNSGPPFDPLQFTTNPSRTKSHNSDKMNDGSVRNIVVIGAAWAGQSTAHYFLRHILPTLKSTSGSLYRVVLIDSSSHFYYKLAAPRALVDTKSMPLKPLFTPVEQGFKQYGDKVTFHHGTVTSIDKSDSLVHFNLADGGKGQVRYFSLVIASGTRTPTPLTSLHGDHNKTIKAIDSMNERLKVAKEVVITGGGPIGIETAGEIGEKLNGQSGISGRKVKITVIAGGKKIIPVLRDSLGKKAEQLLNKVGVEVVYNAKVTKVELGGQDTSTEKGFETTDDSYAESGETQAHGGIKTSRSTNPDGKTIVHLDNGRTLQADVYIPATGTSANTEFLPKDWVDSTGFVKCNPKTLRVEAAGPRVYVVGDCGSYSRGGVLDLFDAMPIVMTNMWNDLVHANTEGGKSTSAKDRSYIRKEAETQIVPVCFYVWSCFSEDAWTNQTFRRLVISLALALSMGGSCLLSWLRWQRVRIICWVRKMALSLARSLRSLDFGTLHRYEEVWKMRR